MANINGANRINTFTINLFLMFYFSASSESPAIKRYNCALWHANIRHITEKSFNTRHALIMVAIMFPGSNIKRQFDSIPLKFGSEEKAVPVNPI